MPKISLRAYDREIEALIEQGQRIDEAVAHCTRILELHPRHLETLCLLGKAHLEAKRYELAVDSFERVLASVPEDFVSHVGLSVIAGDTGKLDDAISHMERAFEAQPSNAAVQGELQRLFGRRDGLEPPKIRLTRGALAHMYMQGELYSQAISEARGVVLNDSKRSDMQCLLARAYFCSGQQTEAVQVCTELLTAYPYCLDANRLMAQMLKRSRQEGSAEQFRERLIELDPYAAFATESLLDTASVADSAITLDRLDYSGLQPDLSTVASPEPQSESYGIAFDAGAPSWLSGGASERGIHRRESLATDDIPPFLRRPSQLDPGPAPVEVPTKQAEEIEWMRGEVSGNLPSWMRALPLAKDGAASQIVAAQNDPPHWLRKVRGGQSATGDLMAAAPEASEIPRSAPGGRQERDEAVASLGNLSSGPGGDPDPLLRNLAAPESSNTVSEQQWTPSKGDPSGLHVESHLDAASADEAVVEGADNIANALALDWGNGVDAVEGSGDGAMQGENAWTPIIEELDAPDWLVDANPTEIQPSVRDEIPEAPLQFDTRIDDSNRHHGLDVARSGTPSSVSAQDEVPPWLRPGVERKPQFPAPKRSSDWRPLKPDEWSADDNSGMHGDAPGLIASERSDSESGTGSGASPQAASLPADRTSLRSGPRSNAMEPNLRGQELVSLGDAQSALGRGNIAAALDVYGKLIRKGESLEEIIRDLRDALYRYPVEVAIWQALGDAYMRANRVPEALDAYTKAEELLR